MEGRLQETVSQPSAFPRPPTVHTHTLFVLKKGNSLSLVLMAPLSMSGHERVCAVI